MAAAYSMDLRSERNFRRRFGVSELHKYDRPALSIAGRPSSSSNPLSERRRKSTRMRSTCVRALTIGIASRDVGFLDNHRVNGIGASYHLVPPSIDVAQRLACLDF